MNDTLIIVLHEIYGVNDHIRGVTENYIKSGFASICPDLYGGGTCFGYTEQTLAYRHFMDNMGFEKASRAISELAASKRKKYRKIFLCGYSIGATISWLCSQDENIDGIIGFYGSRIRDYSEIEPVCPSLLIFPTHEESFDVQAFVSSFKKKNVELQVLEGKHGFADFYSPNYFEPSFQEANKLVNNFLEKAT